MGSEVAAVLAIEAESEVAAALAIAAVSAAAIASATAAWATARWIVGPSVASTVTVRAAVAVAADPA